MKYGPLMKIKFLYYFNSKRKIEGNFRSNGQHPSNSSIKWTVVGCILFSKVEYIFLKRMFTSTPLLVLTSFFVVRSPLIWGGFISKIQRRNIYFENIVSLLEKIQVSLWIWITLLYVDVSIDLNTTIVYEKGLKGES